MDADNVDFLGLPRPRSARPSAAAACPSTCRSARARRFSGVVDVLDPPADVPADCPMHPAEAYQMVVEQIVETDEGLMERYLEGETIPPDELRDGRPRGDHPRAR